MYNMIAFTHVSITHNNFEISLTIVPKVIIGSYYLRRYAHVYDDFAILSTTCAHQDHNISSRYILNKRKVNIHTYYTISAITR